MEISEVKSLPWVLKLTVASAGAVQAYQTEVDAAKPSWVCSPISAVAEKLLSPITKTGRPETTVALARLSFAGGGTAAMDRTIWPVETVPVRLELPSTAMR